MSQAATSSESNPHWVGKLPKHWKVLATRRICKLTTGERDTQDADENGEYPFYVRSQTIERIGSYSFEGEGVLTAGDGAGVGKIFHHAKGKFEFHQRVYLYYDFKHVTGRFFFYYLREHLHLVALAGNAKSTVDSLRRPMLMDFPVVVPTLPEQEVITRFLDGKTAAIDSLIQKKERLIELLQEKRQALITQAVTKGLDASVPMKDSEVTVIGQIPDHWSIRKPKAFCTKIVDGVHAKPEYIDEGVPFLTVRNLTAGPGISFEETKFISQGDHLEFIRRANPEAGDILVTKDGTLGVCRVIETDRIFSIFVSLALVKLNPRMADSQFIRFVLESTVVEQQFKSRRLGSALQHIHLEELRDVSVPLPPLPEQREIGAYVRSLSSEFDKLMADMVRSVERLREYRQSLISAAVTGQIDLAAME